MTAPIDLDHLDQYICGDAALLDEVLTIFEEQALSWVEKLVPSLDDEQWAHAAHSLKGASRGVGAWAVGDLAEEAESLVGDDAVEKRAALVLKLAVETQAAVEFARKVRDGEGTKLA